MVTILVATQVIRITQNAIQLRRQNKMIKQQLKAVDGVTDFDIQRQRYAYELIIVYLERKLFEMEGKE
jgi:hypothetical protein